MEEDEKEARDISKDRCTKVNWKKDLTKAASTQHSSKTRASTLVD